MAESQSHKSRAHTRNSSHSKIKDKMTDEAAPNLSELLLGEFFQLSTKPEEISSSSSEMKLQMENSRRNLDILFSGANFIKGSRYEVADKDHSKLNLNGNKGEASESNKENGVGQEGSKENNESEKNAEKKEDRYFTDKSTVRCRKCKQFGHMSMGCPNEAVYDRVCIYCAEPTHEQFDCPNRLCFKCNQKGHKAYECHEINPRRCFRCEQTGHKADQCTVIAPPIGPKDLQKMACIQCRRQGHAMCDVPKKLRVKWAILQEYKDAKREMMKKLLSANDDINDIGDGLGIMNGEELNLHAGADNKHIKMTERRFMELKEKRKRYKKAEKASNDPYCCYCGNKHMSFNCRNKPSNSGHAHE